VRERAQGRVDSVGRAGVEAHCGVDHERADAGEDEASGDVPGLPGRRHTLSGDLFDLQSALAKLRDHGFVGAGRDQQVDLAQGADRCEFGAPELGGVDQGVR
jgi:hypothetical protein